MSQNPIIKSRNLCKYFLIKEERKSLSLRPEQITVRAVNEISIDVKERENFAFVGESGSGKTTLGYLLARILDPTSGEIWFDGKDITHTRGRNLIELRRSIQMVFQDPGTSLNPRHKIESILSLPLHIHTPLKRREVKKKVAELMEDVHLPHDMMQWYPGALSGGQKQRVNLARALILKPKLLILDEPTSALDVSVQAKILQLLQEIKEAMRLTYIFITHDLSIVKNLSDRIAVMYFGMIVELASTSALFNRPAHPYTKALLSAIPIVDEEEKKILPKEVILEGEIPSPATPLKRCPFFSRCPERQDICEKATCPELGEVEEGHFVRCVNLK